jgi:hypothetical protein
MMGGGWIWDPSPSRPITVDNRSGLDVAGASAKWNAAAKTTIFAPSAAGANANVVFQREAGPMYRNGVPAQGRIQMWVQIVRSGGYVSKCIIHYDPTYLWGNQQLWSRNIVGHEMGHCLDYPDVPVGAANGYLGVMSYENFTDTNWQAANWWGADDQAMLARDGYGP